MTKYLLDTHTAIWFFSNSNKLSNMAKMVIDNTYFGLCVSIVSVWEIAVKVSTGRADFRGNVHSFLKEVHSNGIELVNILPNYLEIVETLPFVHKDPFDRLLIATAKAENMTILTADENIQKYDARWIW